MKKIYIFIIICLMLPFAVSAQQEPDLYINGSLTEEGSGYIIEGYDLYLNGYNGGSIEIVGDGTEDLNFIINVNKDSIITTIESDNAAISIRNGNKKANLTIKSDNNSKLVINCGGVAIFTNNDLLVENNSLEVYDKLINTDVNESTSIIYGENILINKSNIKIEQSVLSNELSFFKNFIVANRKIDVKKSDIELIVKNNSSVGLAGFSGQYISIESSNIEVNEDKNVITLVAIPINIVQLKDNYVKVEDSNISTSGVILGNSALFVGSDIVQPNDKWIESVEINNSSILSKNDNTNFNYYESVLFDAVVNFKIINTKIVSENADGLVYGVNDLLIDNSEINLKNAVAGNIAVLGSIVANSIKLNKSSFIIDNNKDNIQKEITPHGFHTSLFEATDSKITFNNVFCGIDVWNELKMKNTEYKQTGGSKGIHSYILIDLDSSAVDIDVDVEAISMMKSFENETQTFKISDDMYFDNKNYKLVYCKDDLRNTWTLSESDICPAPGKEIKQVKILKRIEKVSEKAIETNVTNETVKDNPNTGMFLPISCVLILSGGCVIFFISNKLKKMYNI